MKTAFILDLKFRGHDVFANSRSLPDINLCRVLYIVQINCEIKSPRPYSFRAQLFTKFLLHSALPRPTEVISAEESGHRRNFSLGMMTLSVRVRIF